MRAVMLHPTDPSQSVELELPGETEAVIIGGQVFHRSYIVDTSGVIQFRQIPFVSLDPQTGDIVDALEIADRALRFVKGWFNKLEDGLPKSDPLVKLRTKFHAPVHAALDNAIARIEELSAAEQKATPEPEEPPLVITP